MYWEKHTMFHSSKDLLQRVLLTLYYVHCTSSTLLKHVYTVKTVGTRRDVANSSCQLVDLRPDFRNSIVHQLRPYYYSGDLANTNLFWVGLARASPSDQFSWSDGTIQTNLTLGDIVHTPRDNAKDGELCVAIKWSNGRQSFITRIESCVAEYLPFCEADTGKPCDYVRLGDVYITPDEGYQVQDISGIDTRALCENECTDWSETNSDECWMFTYNAGSRSCRLVTENVMPHWEETCSWFSYDGAWEAWNRNCLDVKVLDQQSNEIILGPCVLPTPSYIIRETTSSFLRPTLPSGGVSVVPSAPDMTSADLGLTSSPVSDSMWHKARFWSTFPNEVLTSSGEDIISSEPSSFVHNPVLSGLTGIVTGQTIADLSTRFYDLSHHAETSGQTVLGMQKSSLISTKDISVISAVMRPTAVWTSLTESAHVAYTLSTSQSPITTTTTSDLSAISSIFSHRFSPRATETQVTLDQMSGIYEIMNIDHTSCSTQDLTSTTSGTSITMADKVPVTARMMKATPVQTSFTETVRIGYALSTLQNLTTPTSDASTSVATETDCPKICPCNQTISGKIKADVINEILASLSVDKKNTSAYRRQYTSAPDERPLSVGLGWCGVFLLVFVCGGILILDSTKLFNDALVLLSNIKSLFTGKKN